MKTKYRMYDGEGDYEDLLLPSKYEVCWRCHGAGVHDCWEGGMTGDEMAEQGPEFFEDYMSGVYDKRCDECKGNRVLAEVDESALSAEMRKRYYVSEEERRRYEAELAVEARWGY